MRFEKKVRHGTIKSGKFLQSIKHSYDVKIQHLKDELETNQLVLEAQCQALQEYLEDLEESRNNYATLYDFAPVGYVNLDHQGCIREINLTGASIIGVERTQLIGSPLSFFVAKNDFRLFLDHLISCRRKDEKVITDLRFATKSGALIDVQLLSVPDKNTDGRSSLYKTVFTDITERKHYEQELARLERLNLISEVETTISSHFEEKLQIATEETRQELLRFKEAFSKAIGLEKIVINSELMRKTFLLAAKMHEDRKLPVLIEGETGTGKEVIAKYIHYGNGTVTTPFIALNCAAIAPSIFESELFGYEAGAFTGGLAKGQKGKLDLAKGGTLFLDEITELPLDLQAKLLRVLQENEYFRVGGQKVLYTDVRIICATNQKIEDTVAEGKFRKDLYYRLNVGRIHLPPLRERVEDILPLANSFLKAFAEEKGSQFRAINHKAVNILEAYEWPGNVREIRNAMQRVVLLWDDWEVKPEYLDFLYNSNRNGQLENDKSPAVLDLNDMVLPADQLPIEDIYNTIVSKALEFNNGNKTKTAQYLQISRNSLNYRLKQMEQNET